MWLSLALESAITAAVRIYYIDLQSEGAQFLVQLVHCGWELISDTAELPAGLSRLGIHEGSLKRPVLDFIRDMMSRYRRVVTLGVGPPLVSASLEPRVSRTPAHRRI